MDTVKPSHEEFELKIQKFKEQHVEILAGIEHLRRLVRSGRSPMSCEGKRFSKYSGKR